MNKTKLSSLLSVFVSLQTTIFYFLLFCTFISCQDEKIKKPVKNDDPMVETTDILTIYSDSAKVKIQVKASKQYTYANGNIVYPTGIEIIFMDTAEKETTRLTAKKATFDKLKNIYVAERDVVVFEKIEKKTLKTASLVWSPLEKQIKTDSSLVITTPTQIIKGNGMIAAQDFSRYEIIKPTGIIDAED
jgi:LPS export ABC transporter protein LptC